MLFSVIIPTYNRPDLLQLCLDGISPLVQELSMFEYEVIVSDDSIDDSTRTLMLTKFPQFIWLKGPRRGPAANRNNGVNKAIGKWLIFLDDDCMPSKRLLKEYSSAIQKHPVLRVFEGAIRPVGVRTSPLEYAPVNLSGGNLWSCNFCIQKDFFYTIGLFDEKFKFPHMEDVDLADRVRVYPEQIIFVPEAFVEHPWRKLRSGVKLGLYQEMYVYYHAKNNKKLSLRKLVTNILRVHLSLIKRNILSRDVFLAIWITITHVVTVLFYFKKWRFQYAS